MKWRAAREFVERGMRAAFERDDEVRFLTLTDGSRKGDMTIKQLSGAWDDLAKLLRAGGPAPPRPPRGSGAAAQRRWRNACRARRPFLSEYALVLELGPRGGRLHAHVILTGRYIHQPKLAGWARRCGFGAVVDIRSVNAASSEEVARYALKLAGYSSKAGQEVALMRSRAGRRLRPLRTSRGWFRADCAKSRPTLAFAVLHRAKTPGRGCSSDTTEPASSRPRGRFSESRARSRLWAIVGL
jgi:hypothetical protein